MTATREEMKVEAIKRMKSIDIFEETIKQFEHDDLVSISEPPFGAFFWLDDEQKAQVAEFEDDYGYLIYVGVRWFTNIGRMDSYLFVSSEKDEWPMEQEDLVNHEPIAYVVNHDAIDYSEMGAIGIVMTKAAGLKRIW